MDASTLLAAAALPAAIVVITVVRAIVVAARTPRPHDDRMRVGSEGEISASDAYRRARGKSAWMQSGGGGI